MHDVDTHVQVSVRAENAETLAEACPFVYVARLLGTHWRPSILYKIASGVVTYNALRLSLTPITDKMLATELRTLVETGLVAREELGRNPRRSRYRATPRGASLLPVLAAMEGWAERDREHDSI